MIAGNFDSHLRKILHFSSFPCVRIGSYVVAMFAYKKYGHAGYVDDPLPNVAYLAIGMPACIVWLYYSTTTESDIFLCEFYLCELCESSSGRINIVAPYYVSNACNINRINFSRGPIHIIFSHTEKCTFTVYYGHFQKIFFCLVCGPLVTH